jgi:hypothetical protein
MVETLLGLAAEGARQRGCKAPRLSGFFSEEKQTTLRGMAAPSGDELHFPSGRNGRGSRASRRVSVKGKTSL